MGELDKGQLVAAPGHEEQELRVVVVQRHQHPNKRSTQSPFLRNWQWQHSRDRSCKRRSPSRSHKLLRMQGLAQISFVINEHLLYTILNKT